MRVYVSQSWRDLLRTLILEGPPGLQFHATFPRTAQPPGQPALIARIAVGSLPSGCPTRLCVARALAARERCMGRGGAAGAAWHI
eukprot:2998998-Prymnesium_polylepis.1